MSLNKKEKMKGFKMSEFSREIHFPYIPLLTYKHSVMADEEQKSSKQKRKELEGTTLDYKEYWDEVLRQEDNLKEDKEE